MAFTKERLEPVSLLGQDGRWGLAPRWQSSNLTSPDFPQVAILNLPDDWTKRQWAAHPSTSMGPRALHLLVNVGDWKGGVSLTPQTG